MPDTFLFPRTMVELDGMLGNLVPESVHLDYKASDGVDSAKKPEIAKDASAFANSDGGVLIYGIGEDKVNKVFFKDVGIDRKRYSGEWFDQVLMSNINPRISGIEIADIPVSPTHSYFALKIPRSTGTVYQDRTTKKFFKRYELISVAMEEYEINDVRARSALVPRLVTFDVEPKHRFLAYFVIENIGSFPARNVTFDFSHVLTWPSGQERPSIFEKGIRYLPPGKKYWCRYHSFPDLLAPMSKLISELTVTVGYSHPQIEDQIREDFHIDLKDYQDLAAVISDITETGEKLEKVLQDIRTEVKTLADQGKHWRPLIGATGLDLSFATLKSLQKILTGKDFWEPVNPSGFNMNSFREILGVDSYLALALERHFLNKNSIVGIKDIPDITDEIIQKLKDMFILSDLDKFDKSHGRHVA